MAAYRGGMIMLKEVSRAIYHLLHLKMVFFLTSVSKKGIPNVMTCAWATPVSDEPPIVVVCVSKESHTASLIKQGKEYVINIPTKRQLKALWICGKRSGKEADKFKKAGLEYRPGRKVKAPVIEGCIGYIECRLWKTVDAGECYAFFGEVVNASADPRYLKKGLWAETSEILFHLGGSRIVYLKG